MGIHQVQRGLSPRIHCCHNEPPVLSDSYLPMAELRLFGAMQLDGLVDGEGPLASQPKRLALLAYLAVMADRGAPRRDKLLALLWPELDDAHGRNALSQSLHIIRKSIGADSIVTNGDDAIRLSPEVWVDVIAFDRALREKDFAAAMELYRGELLDGFHISRAPEFERWLDVEREERRRAAVAAAFSLADAAVAAQDSFAVQRWTARALEFSGLEESDARRAMTLLDECGDPAGALGVYDRLVAALRAEHAVAPARETSAIAERIRARPMPIAVVKSSPPAGIVSRGASRVRNRWGAGMALVGLAGLALAITARRTPPDSSDTSLTRLPIDAGTARPAGGIAGPTLALSPNGRTLVYVGVTRGGTQLFARRLDRVDAQPIDDTEGARQPFFSPDGEWIGFEQNGALRVARIDGGGSRTIRDVGAPIRGAAWSTQGFIIYGSDEGLCRVPVAGGEPAVVNRSDAGVIYRWPDLMPDGNVVVFTMTTARGAWLATHDLTTGRTVDLRVQGGTARWLGRNRIAFTNNDGTLRSVAYDPGRGIVTGAIDVINTEVLVGNAGAGKFAVARSGAIVFIREPKERRLVFVDAFGRRTIIDSLPRRYTAVRASPDTNWLAVEVATTGPFHADLWLFDLQRREIDRLTTDSASLAPVWSRNGERLIYSSVATPAPGFKVSELVVRTRQVSRAVLGPQRGQVPGGVTPDGLLVFQRNDIHTGWDVWSAPLDGSRPPTLLIGGAKDQFAATLSPDGQRIAYVSNESGLYRVYVRPLHGKASTTVAEGTEPRWSPNGRELYFRDRSSMNAASVDPGNPIHVGRARRLFDDHEFATADYGTAYDVDRTGRFVMLERTGTGGELVLLLNAVRK